MYTCRHTETYIDVHTRSHTKPHTEPPLCNAPNMITVLNASGRERLWGTLLPLSNLALFGVGDHVGDGVTGSTLNSGAASSSIFSFSTNFSCKSAKERALVY